MFKRILIICFLCVILTACENEVSEESIPKDVYENESGSNAGSEEKTDNTVMKAESNMTDEEGREKIVNILYEVQQNESFIDFGFFENDMYVLTSSEDNVILRRYDMDTWEGSSSVLEIENSLTFDLIPNSNGVVIKVKTFGENDCNYIFDKELTKIAECRGILADYSAKGNTLFYYDIDENIIYGKQIDNGEIRVVREFSKSDEKETDDIILIEEMAISSDGNYIVYSGQCWENTGGVQAWGYIDVNNIENDVMYKENKTIKASENGVIITYSQSGQYMIGQEPILSKEYQYFYDGIKKDDRYFENAEESDTGIYSSEGNILLTSHYEEAVVITLYDIVNDNIIKSDRGDELSWVEYGTICEKFKTIIWMKAIHESPDAFSPTGKFEICQWIY